VGDLVTASVAIEEGAYFKGSIDIARDEGSGGSSDVPAQNALRNSA
jgi:hypothetical protein